MADLLTSIFRIRGKAAAFISTHKYLIEYIRMQTKYLCYFFSVTQKHIF